MCVFDDIDSPKLAVQRDGAFAHAFVRRAWQILRVQENSALF